MITVSARHVDVGGRELNVYLHHTATTRDTLKETCA
jgi:hypothetical protein